MNVTTSIRSDVQRTLTPMDNFLFHCLTRDEQYKLFDNLFEQLCLSKFLLQGYGECSLVNGLPGMKNPVKNLNVQFRSIKLLTKKTKKNNEWKKKIQITPR